MKRCLQKPLDEGKKGLQCYFFLCIISIAASVAVRSLDLSNDGIGVVCCGGFWVFLFLFLMSTYIATVSVTMTFFPKQKQDRGRCGIFLMRDCVITGISQISFPLKQFFSNN